MSDTGSEKQRRLSKEEWKVQKKNAIRVKYASPKKRFRRCDELKKRIKSHSEQKQYYERLIRNAAFELVVLRELDTIVLRELDARETDA